MTESDYTFAQGVSDVQNSLLSLIGARNEVRRALDDGKPAGSANAPTSGGGTSKGIDPLWIVGGAIALVFILKAVK